MAYAACLGEESDNSSARAYLFTLAFRRRGADTCGVRAHPDPGFGRRGWHPCRARHVGLVDLQRDQPGSVIGTKDLTGPSLPAEATVGSGLYQSCRPQTLWQEPMCGTPRSDVECGP